MFEVSFISLSTLWGNAVDGPAHGLCKQHRANLFLPVITILGTLREAPLLVHRGHMSGVWLEGFSFCWCGGPDLFQGLLSHEEPLTEYG